LSSDGAGGVVTRALWTGSQPDCAPVSRQGVRLLNRESIESHVANIKSQIKRNRQNERRRVRNKSVRSEMRTRTKTASVAIDAGAEDADDSVRAAVRRIDKAAAQGVIHKNQAANRKSRLMRRAAVAGLDEH
jgi:small subunit ribosomal protein S20